MRSRTIGRHCCGEPGPLLVCTAAVHGDEPAGLEALERVFSALDELRPPLRGEVVGLVGNRTALARDRRYVRYDLNRIWLRDRLGRLEEALGRVGGEPGALHDEELEQWELLKALRTTLAGARGEVFFLDLHTSSAAGRPFVCIGDTLRNRSFALQFPVPVILGLEECIDGALLEYVNNLGVVTMGVEAGQHLAATSVDHHESVIWLALVAAGLLDEDGAPDVAGHRARLQEAAGQLPPIMEVHHRHPIDETDEFRMEPGFYNFQPVEAGELLARDRTGPVRAREAGRILLPLYQGLGSDGFFLTREVRPLWLRLSALLRHLRLDAFLHWLPGVRRHPGERASLVIDRRIARWYAIEIFHLLGYRKRRPVDGKLVVSRRQFDHRSPFAA